MLQVVKRSNLHIAFFGEVWIREVDMDCRYEENKSGHQKEKVKKNEDWPNIHAANLVIKKLVAWDVDEKIGIVKVSNEKKWWNLEVGGTAAESSA